MCKCNGDGSCAPRSVATIAVTYCHDHARWYAAVTVEGHTVGGQTIVMSSGSHAFGPFDSSTEVGQWLSSQQRVTKAMCHGDIAEVLSGE